ncbi:MAG: N-6 DNA methylase [Armatimonadota bacterium]|nr:N-6 DNA methylase [Armatimonadota bacterium]
MATSQEKQLGQFFTPEAVAQSLVRWAVRSSKSDVLDPSCGDGEFLRHVNRPTGVELCAEKAALARNAAPEAEVIVADFFEWAQARSPSFDAVVGNPPFIRYHQFNGSTRKRALKLSQRIGAEFSGLTSSWAPFVAVSASLLKPGGRLAFVVPAEIGHATYAAPLVEGLCRHFAQVTVVAIREKLFPHLSQDAWLLYADGKGSDTRTIGFSAIEEFAEDLEPEHPHTAIPLTTWRELGGRLRKFLVPPASLGLYHELSNRVGATVVEGIADVTIGYVSGANDFFHFTPSAAAMFEIPQDCLRPTVRRGEQLTADYVDDRLVRRWLADNDAVLVLDLSSADMLPSAVERYLDSPEGQEVRKRYKCRVRDPWYVIPGVDQAPSAFITCMSGRDSRLSINRAGAVCTNSVLAVSLKQQVRQTDLLRGWRHPLSRLSQELEGHPLGGGMLKLEPGEARRTYIPLPPFRSTKSEDDALTEAVEVMRTWRHYGPEAERT